MANGSPSAQRVVAILNFFGDHPGQAFTLTDLVRSLRLSRATAHAFLTTLADAGYLYRASDKSYVLGPALATIGEVAAKHFSPLQVAQPEMRRLADEFDVVCSAIFRERNDVVVRERATSHSNLGFTLPRGGRLPMRPPFGSIFFASSPVSAIDGWLAQLTPPPAPGQRDDMIAGLLFLRDHGFQFTVRTANVEPEDMSSEWLFAESIEDRPVELASALDEQGSYALSAVTAPVYGPDGGVAFVLALAGFSARQASGAEIAAIGERLRGAADRIGGFFGKPA